MAYDAVDLPAARTRSPILNAMTIDVEDYFHVSAFAEVVRPHTWDSHASRVEANTDRLLAMFAETRVRGTFFVLGWVAERYPGLVRRIAQAGHEIASHSYAHQLVYDLDAETFRADLRRARGLIEDLSGRPVRGFRAPSYSVTERSLWALDVLIEEGYTYDASIFPIHHDRYGIPGAPRHAHVIERAAGTIVARANADSKGEFRILAPAGQYELHIDTHHARYPRCQSKSVQVADGQIAHVDIACDSGMR
jgi:polysaccharide deacetylase family protein (PEP-CTERM system associated)